MNKKVLIVVNDFTTVYHFRMELVEYLIQRGEKVYVALPDDERNEQLKAYGAEVLQLAINRFGTNPLEDIKTFFSIKKIIHSIHPDIVFTYTAKPNIYGGMACRFTKTPHVANITGLGANFDKQNIVSKIMLMLQKFAFKKSKMVFFQNESNLSFFKSKKIVRNNYALLPGSGVNLEANAFEEYPNNQATKFITIARIRKDKGYDELFYAINKAKQEKLNAEFHIVGWYEDDDYKRKVEALSKNDHVVFYNGVPHEEVHNLIANCDCLIHPSHHEGMSNVILEAAATGRPAIVSNIHGCVEGVDDTKTGLYFEVKNPDDLYHKIVKFTGLTMDEKSALGLNARKKAEIEFDRQLVVKKYYDLIE